MLESFYPLLSLLLIYAIVGGLTRTVKKAVRPSGTAPRRPAASPGPDAAGSPAASPDAAAASPAEPAARRPDRDDSLYQGSLNAVTGEGYDPCHAEQLSALDQAETVEEAPQTVPGLQLSWSGDEIVRGMIISEVLKRRGA